MENTAMGIQFIPKSHKTNHKRDDDCAVSLNKAHSKCDATLSFSFSENSFYKCFRNTKYLLFGVLKEKPSRIYIAPATGQAGGYKISVSPQGRKYAKPAALKSALPLKLTDYIGFYQIEYDRENTCWFIDTKKKMTYGEREE